MMTIYIMFIRTFSTSTRVLTRSQFIANKLPQVIFTGSVIRLDKKQLSVHCRSGIYLERKRTHLANFAMTMKSILFRGINCTHCHWSNSVMLLSGELSTMLSIEALKERNYFLCEIVGQLNEDHGIDVCVIETTEERKKYADYIIVVTGASTRHLKAMTNHLYEKSKKNFNGKIALVSGMESNDWMIVDIGSIVVHLFLPEVREKYNLEKLWSLGPDYDEQYKAMIEDDQFSEIVKNAKLEDFFIKKE